MPRDLHAMRLGAGDDEVLVISFELVGDARLDDLTPAERETVSLAAAGWTNAAIARARGVANATVAKQLESAYRKLRLGSRAELASLLRPRRG